MLWAKGVTHGWADKFMHMIIIRIIAHNPHCLPSVGVLTKTCIQDEGALIFKHQLRIIIEDM